MGKDLYVDRDDPLCFETVQEFFQDGGFADQLFAKDSDILPISVPEVLEALMEQIQDLFA